MIMVHGGGVGSGYDDEDDDVGVVLMFILRDQYKK